MISKVLPQSTHNLINTNVPTDYIKLTATERTDSTQKTINSITESNTEIPYFSEEISCTVELLEPTDLQPEDVRLEQSKSLLANCSCINVTSTDHIVWLSPDGYLITGNYTSRIFAVDGTLNIESAQLNDSGTYQCGVSNINTNFTMPLQVYVMPNYLVEGMIILGINIALLVILIGCFLQSYLHEKQQTKKYSSFVLKASDK